MTLNLDCLQDTKLKLMLVALPTGPFPSCSVPKSHRAPLTLARPSISQDVFWETLVLGDVLQKGFWGVHKLRQCYMPNVAGA